MHNKSDINHLLKILAIASSMAMMIFVGWVCGRMLIAHECRPSDAVPPTFTVFSETFTCSQVAP